MCDLVFIVVHDEEKSDVSISGLYLDGTGSCCCLANTIVITDIRIAACEILPVRKKEPPLDGEGELCLRRGEEPRSALYVLSPCIHCATFKDSGPSEQVRDCHTREILSTESSGSRVDRELRVCATTQHRPPRSLLAHHHWLAENPKTHRLSKLERNCIPGAFLETKQPRLSKITLAMARP